MKLFDSITQLIGTAEGCDDVVDRSVIGKGWNLQHIRKNELGVAVFGIFFEQFFKHLAGFGCEAREEVGMRLLHLLGAFTAGTQGCVVGEMAEQVKGVGVRLVGSGGEILEADAAFLQQPDQFGTQDWVSPAYAKFGGRRAEGADLVGCIVGITYNAELFAV